jgi:glycosyltransferase involved in cell wall biosynthesis
VVIPTRDRSDVLAETLESLERAADEAAFEVVVVDDGSRDATPAVLASFAQRQRIPVSLVAQLPRGPAAARNAAIRVARAETCLFLGDDTRPRPGLLARHARFHRSKPSLEHALLGHITWARDSKSPFTNWLDRSGIQFDYAGISDPSDVEPSFFYTANVSVKTAFLRTVGGFDEVFVAAACEDVELGYRLSRLGMRLAYDRGAVAEHHHPTGLDDAIRRMHVVGRSSAILAVREPGRPVPRAPGLRHRVGSAALVALNLMPWRSDRVRTWTWRFLCHEAHREGFWGFDPGVSQLFIGSRLAELAARDPAARRPQTGYLVPT